MKNLKRRLGALNSLEKEVGNMPEFICMGMDLLSSILIVEALRPAVNKWKSKEWLGLRATNLLSG